MPPLEKEYRYFVEHRDELVAKHEGKTLVIREEGVVGVFDSDMDARREARKKYKPGTYLIHCCTRPEDEEVLHFHSRVCFECR